MSEIGNFIKLSKYAGERFDLVQGSGGNSSVQLDNGLMLIKASGFMLSDVARDKGYVKVRTENIIRILENKKISHHLNKVSRDKLASNSLKKAVLNGELRPSIETFLHVLLYKYTLHTHPLIVNAAACSKNWKNILVTLFNKNILLMEYKTPGIELAIELKKAIKSYRREFKVKPNAVFIQNHGLIVSADNPEKIMRITESILNKLEQFFGIDFDKYKMTNRISILVNSLGNTNYISYLSSDFKLNRLLKTKRRLFFKSAFFPDSLVYCGFLPLKIHNLEDKRAFIDYHNKYHGTPKVIIYEDHIFFVANNLNKAKEIEDVFKLNIFTQDIIKGKINFLNRQELLYLSNWEAERYRQNL